MLLIDVPLPGNFIGWSWAGERDLEVLLSSTMFMVLLSLVAGEAVLQHSVSRPGMWHVLAENGWGPASLS